jgi:hypothetical protein
MSAGQVRHDGPGMIAVGRGRYEGPLAQRQQIILVHEAQDALVIGVPAFPVQQGGDHPIAGPPVGQRQALDGVAQRHLFLPRCRGLPGTVIARPADPSQPAHLLDAQAALRRRRDHLSDDRVDGGATGASFVRGASFTRRKAL